MISIIREPSTERKIGRVIGITAPYNAANHARRNDAAKEFSLGEQYRKHSADDETARA